jgi:hypothetical protein
MNKDHGDVRVILAILGALAIIALIVVVVLVYPYGMFVYRSMLPGQTTPRQSALPASQKQVPRPLPPGADNP